MKVGKRSGHSFVALLLTAVRKGRTSSTSHGRPWETWQVIHSGRTCGEWSSTCVDKTHENAKSPRNSQLFHKSS
ncbi:hypothetical protein F9K94_10745 [Brucella tritici]|uniref:Uncharacterized protein n=1 Tax=Brucella tritici TaxID=94626 RepID=A0A7V8B2W2_9HYPH|nr:hypothetical protein F9K94_10745 [Brucella tritici]